MMASLTCAEVGAEDAPPFDAGSTRVLAALSAALESESFSFKTRDLLDVPQGDNRMVQFEGRYTVHVQRPNRMYAQGTVDENALTLWYTDGKLTIYNKNAKTVAETAAPRDLDEFLDWIATEHDILLPGHDFLYSNLLKTVRAGADSGRHVGVVQSKGKSYEHLQFQDEQYLWELWVASDSPAVPVRLLIRDPGAFDVLCYEAEYSGWRFGPAPRRIFITDVPADAKTVSMKELVSGLEKVE